MERAGIRVVEPLRARAETDSRSLRNEIAQRQFRKGPGARGAHPRGSCVGVGKGPRECQRGEADVVDMTSACARAVVVRLPSAPMTVAVTS